MKTLVLCFATAISVLIWRGMLAREEKHTATREAYNEGIRYAVNLMHLRKIMYVPEHEVKEVTNCVLVQVVHVNAAPIKMESGGSVSYCQFHAERWPELELYGRFWHAGAEEFFDKELKEGLSE